MNITGQDARPADAASERFWFLLPYLTVALMLAAALARPYFVNPDVGLELACAQEMLDGGTPYVDWVELNPPQIVYVNLVPALLAEWTGLPPTLAILLLVTLLTGLATYAMQRLLLSRTEMTVDQVGIFLTAFAGQSLYLVIICQSCEREHLFMLTLLPYFLVRWLRSEGKTIPTAVAVIVGVGASLTACFKPHFVVLALLPEIWWIARTRSLRQFLTPEFYAFTITGFAYAGHFLLLSESYRQAFFHRWVPLIAKGYRAYYEPFSALIKTKSMLLMLTIAALPFVLRPRREESWRQLPLSLGVLAFGAIAIFIVQHKGWYYHRIPMHYGATLIVAALIAYIRPIGFAGAASDSAIFRLPLTARSSHRLLITALALILLGGFGLAIKRGFVPPPPIDEVAGAVLNHSKPGDPVLIITSSVNPSYPALTQYERRPGSRYMWHFPIPMFYQGETFSMSEPPYHNRQTASAEELQYLSDLEQDIANRRPMLIIVDNDGECHGCPPRFSVLEYLSVTGVAAAWDSDYTRLTDAEGFAVFKRNS